MPPTHNEECRSLLLALASLPLLQVGLRLSSPRSESARVKSNSAETCGNCEISQLLWMDRFDSTTLPPCRKQRQWGRGTHERNGYHRHCHSTIEQSFLLTGGSSSGSICVLCNRLALRSGLDRDVTPRRRPRSTHAARWPQHTQLLDGNSLPAASHPALVANWPWNETAWALSKSENVAFKKNAENVDFKKKWLDGRDLCQLSHPFRDNHALSQASNRFATVPVDNLLTTTSRCWGRAWASPAQDREILEMNSPASRPLVSWPLA